jgi:hypothetical protein
MFHHFKLLGKIDPHLTSGLPWKYLAYSPQWGESQVVVANLIRPDSSNIPRGKIWYDLKPQPVYGREEISSFPEWGIPTGYLILRL